MEPTMEPTQVYHPVMHEVQPAQPAQPLQPAQPAQPAQSVWPTR